MFNILGLFKNKKQINEIPAAPTLPVPLTEEEFKNNVLLSCPKETDPDLFYADIINNVLDLSINEAPSQAVLSLFNFCGFTPEHIKYFQQKDGENFANAIPNYIVNRLSNVKEISPLLNLSQDIQEALDFIDSDDKSLNIYNANNIKERLEMSVDLLEDPDKAKIHYLSSKMFRKVYSAENVYVESKAKSEELFDLKNMLATTSDYNLILYAQNRIDEKDAPGSTFTRPYKRALKKAQTKTEVHKIALSIASIYAKELQRISFIKNKQDVENAEKYYWQAYNFAPKSAKIDTLNKLQIIANLERDSEKIENIKYLIASKHLSGTDKCKAYIAMAKTFEKSKDKYLNLAYQTVGTKKRPTLEEKSLINKVTTSLGYVPTKEPRDAQRGQQTR